MKRWMDGVAWWMDGWVGEWVDGWIGGEMGFCGGSMDGTELLFL